VPVAAAADLGQCTAGSVALGTPVTGDNCGVASVTNDAPVSFPGGSTVVTWTVTDIHGNQATATQTVTVTDGQKPTISAPPPFTVAVDPGQCTASHVGLGTPATQDNCGIGTVTNDAPGSFPVGATTVTWTVTDVHGNQATAIQTVTVTDQQPPTISCPGNQTVAASSASGAAVIFAVNATDNCGVPSVVSTNQSGQVVTSGSIFPPGTTTVTCKAVDAAGNYSTCRFTVTVTAPNADLSLTMNGSPNPVAAAGNTSLTYTLTVTNNGPQPAQGVVVTDPLPSGTAFTSATTKVGSLTTPKTGSTGTVTWSIPTLGSGQSATLTVVVKVTAKAGATLNNVASVSASSPTDTSPGNNTATVSTPVTKS
jgi:uncharacterized repeat protein (TIGR01451 family)